MKPKLIGYWTTTGILEFVLLSGGAAQVMHQRETVAGIMLLGYPEYFVTIVGAWKILGAITILLRRFPTLREWAYAGIFFEMTGAAVSHAMCGDYGTYAFHFFAPLIFAGLALTSRSLYPPPL